MADEFGLERFVSAQAGVYPEVLAELTAGRKRSHWMWFIFPQVRGLGSSPMAQRFGIAGLREAEEYLGHPLLGARLRECTGLVNAVRDCPVEEIFGYPDDLKFRSSMTLFERAAGAEGGKGAELFREALERYFHGEPDAATLKILGG